MDMRLELILVPVSDVDQAKAFYVDQVGFNADHDVQVNPQLRFVQLTPPGSACVPTRRPPPVTVSCSTGTTRSNSWTDR